MLRLASIILYLTLINVSISSGQYFEDVATQLSINPQYISGNNWGTGISFFDVNQDGWDDLTYARDYDSLLVYFNNEGIFTRHAIALPDSGMLKNALWFDYDNDGNLDLFLSFYQGKFYLLKNNGDFIFSDITETSGLSNLPAFNYGATVADVNRDGFLDIYISRYSGIPSHPYHQKYNLLFLGSSDGVFTNVTLESGLNNTVRPTFLSVIFDYDMDGWPDIYEINDRTLFDNIMHRNLGNAMFSDATIQSNSAFNQGHPMTATVGDYDNDGFLDVFMTNSTYNPSLNVTTKVLKNSGNGYFSDVSESVGLALHEFSWGGLWIDHDNNGLQDLYVATSPIVQNAPVYKDIFLRQLDNHTFVKDSTVFADMVAQRNYSIARGDLNNDGFYDIITHSIAPYESNVWLNSGNENNYVKITLEGSVSNRMAIGSWIRVFSGGQKYTQYTMCGENYISQNSQHHIFGLGDHILVDSIHVEYPSGHVDRFYDLDANFHYYLIEGETYLVSILGNESSHDVLCSGESLVLYPDGTHFKYLWNTGDTTQSITVSQSGLYHLTTWNEFGLPAFSDTVEVVLQQEPDVNIVASHVSCPGGMNGSLEVVVSNGIPQQIAWTHGAEGAMLDSLSEGVYSFNGLDSAGCFISGSAYIAEPPPFQSSISTTDVLCHGESTGTVSVLLAGGTQPYDLHWQGVTPDFLPAGSFTLTVMDLNGCELSLAYTIQQPEALFLDVETTPSMQEAATGSAMLYIEGGSPPFDVEWSNGVQDEWVLEELSPGIYQVWVTDSNGCAETIEFEVSSITSAPDGGVFGFRVFPNPTGEYFWIEGCNHQPLDWFLIDSRGVSVAQMQQQICNDPIYVGDFAEGMYILYIQQRHETAALRLVLIR